jgi:murein DD-endopeptidase MepM/ murein hydrolase activator NlpD
MAIVLGSGFWSQDRDQQAVMKGGTDTFHSVSQILEYETRSPASETVTQSSPGTQGLIASTSHDLISGHVSPPSLPATSQQLWIKIYVIQDRQTISSVATDTGLSEETLLWANDYRDPGRTLPEGTQLRIPPTDGMLHVVSEDDTLESIAERYDATPDVITAYEPNDIEDSADLVENQLIMVPGGSMPMRNEAILYTVREGDQLWQIADRFGLRAQTILWANDVTSSNMVRPGQQLAILPTDGVMVETSSDDTVDSLAKEYDVSASAIRDWPGNEIAGDGSLVSGISIMIPGGTPPAPPEPEPDEIEEDEPEETEDAPIPEVAEDDNVYADLLSSAPPKRTEVSPEGTGEFDWPTTGVITQYFHSSHNGWDIADVPGTEIRAADNGRVIFSGWNNYGLGYAVAIDHGNGYQTWYGHMEEHPPVEEDQVVEKGENIGSMGSTGFSTGPHVHFVIAYDGAYQDPGSYLQ